MKIINIIEDSYDHHQLPRRTRIDGIMLHRCGINLQAGIILGETAPELVEIFTGRNPRHPTVTEATGGDNPYTLYVGGHRDSEGVVWQAIPINEVGHHARRWSYNYIGIGCIGDFRKEGPTSLQMSSLVDLLAGLCAAYAFDPYKAIKGHGEVQGGDRAPGSPEACPGHMLNLNNIRYDTELIMRERAYRRLSEEGLVF